jgi:hypothetical protein
MIALLLNNHGAALIRSDTTRAFWDERLGLGGGTQAKQSFLDNSIMPLTYVSNPAPSGKSSYGRYVIENAAQNHDGEFWASEQFPGQHPSLIHAKVIVLVGGTGNKEGEGQVTFCTYSVL